MIPFKLVSLSEEIDKKFKRINWITLCPIFLWPVVFFYSFYIFDESKTDWKDFGLFFLINSYPFLLMLLFEINARMYQRRQGLAYLIPTVTFCILSYVFFYWMASLYQSAERKKLRDQIRKEGSYLGSKYCYTYTYRIKDGIIYYKDVKLVADPKTFETINCALGKDKNKVFYKGKLIEQSDAATFEVISYLGWQKDKFRIYYCGKPMNTIDLESFEVLPKHYAKDRYHVYFNNRILKNADPATFKVNRLTEIARDKNATYKYGKVIAKP